MIDDDIAYFEHRAEAELELAQHATKLEVVAAHCQMANAYLEKITGLRAVERPENASAPEPDEH